MPYDPSAFPPFAVTVDLVVLTVRRHELCTLAVRRGEEPFKGRWALPGGFVRADEDLASAAARELSEETGLRTSAPDEPDPVAHLEQLATYGDPERDPRMRVVSVAHLALAPDLPSPIAGGDASGASWAPVDSLLGSEDSAAPVRGGARAGVLAFDHERILSDGVERARSKIEYSSLATAFCPSEFTVGELRRVYEAVWGVVLDPRNFHRKVTGTPGFLVPTGGTTSRQGGRPAQLFKAGGATLLNPPMLRPEV
jgi:8-oxo-dGTP diphosphatase